MSHSLIVDTTRCNSDSACRKRRSKVCPDAHTGRNIFRRSFCFLLCIFFGAWNVSDLTVVSLNNMNVSKTLRQAETSAIGISFGDCPPVSYPGHTIHHDSPSIYPLWSLGTDMRSKLRACPICGSKKLLKSSNGDVKCSRCSYRNLT